MIRMSVGLPGYFYFDIVIIIVLRRHHTTKADANKNRSNTAPPGIYHQNAVSAIRSRRSKVDGRRSTAIDINGNGDGDDDDDKR